MINRWTRIAVTFATLSLTAQAAAFAQSRIASDIASFLKRPALQASQLGVAFYDLDKGRVLYERDSAKYFVAASTTKVLTESTTLALLGPNYRFTTNVYRNGTVDSSGVLHGDIVLRPSGDSNLSNRIQADGTLAF